MRYLPYAEHRDDHEVEQHHGAEQLAHRVRAAPLHREQANQDRNRQRNHERSQARIHRLEAFDGGQHGHCRRDHRIAEEERGRGNAEENQAGAPFARAGASLNQREQRQAAALALVVGAQDDRHVFHGNDQHQRPEHQAEHAENVQPVDTQRMLADEHLLHRIERARADIAEDHPSGA